MFCVWLLPSKEDELILKKLIKYNQNILKLPCFQPHLTLFDGGKEIDENLIDEFSSLMKNLKPMKNLNLQVLNKVVCESKYYKSFYIRLNTSSALDLIYSKISLLVPFPFNFDKLKSVNQGLGYNT